MTALLGLGLPGRTDRGVEINAEIAALLASNAPVGVGVSGGKDSCAAAIAVVEHLRATGHTGTVVLVHSDLGDPNPELNVEWDDSLPTCERLAAYLGCELLVVRRASGGMMRRWEQRWDDNVARYVDLLCVKVILPWSTPDMRFCTSELKSAPIAAGLVRRFRGRGAIVSACGIRREEGKGSKRSKRTNAPTSKVNKRLCKVTFGTKGVDWNPIAHWSERDVYAFCRARGFELHEGYVKYRMRRISCRYCMMADEHDLTASTTCEANHPVYRRQVRLEARSTFAFQGSRWLADIAPHLLDAEATAAVADAKKRAVTREWIESRIPEHLLYTDGWPTVMPTFAEARMLSEVRIAIGELLGFDVKYTTPDTILARYAELMAENARRNNERAAKAARKEYRR